MKWNGRDALCALVVGLSVLTLDEGRAAALDSFEESAAGWSSEGGTVVVSQAHWKLGKKALRWDFTPGAVLTRAEDESLAAALASRAGGVKLWLYCEKPIRGRVRCRAGSWAFDVNLGFTGWRAAWVVFREDAEAADPVTGLQITAPASSGALFLDAVELGDVPWFRQGDAQTPYTNARRGNGKYWMTTHDWAAEARVDPGRGPTEAEAEAFRHIEQRFEQWMFGHLDDPRKPVRRRIEGVQAYTGTVLGQFWGHLTQFDGGCTDGSRPSATKLPPHGVALPQLGGDSPTR